MAAVSELGVTRCGRAELRWGERTYVMGILNVTPDSFSGDGLADNLEAALEQARRFRGAQDAVDWVSQYLFPVVGDIMGR